MKFSVFQLSRRGGRPLNEDRMGYCYTREAGLFLLADGMGGHAEGEVAAQIALQTIAAQFQREAQPSLADVPAFLASSLLAGHRQILRYAQTKRMRDTPRTTLVAGVIQHGQITWVHCGDSRLYWVRAGQLLARTRDHSLVEMARSGVDIPNAHDNRNVLFTCLGASQRPVFDIDGPHPLAAGDRLLLCSDGLWDVLPESTLLHGLCAHPLEAAVPSLVEAALLAAGSRSDNVTALAVEWHTDADAHHDYALEHVQGAADEDSLFLSTIQPPVPDSDSTEDELDDAAIERSIAEINAAIRRSARKP